jgi:hypothetical protein
MFLLPRNEIPETPEALTQAIEEGLRTFVSRPDKMVVVRVGAASALDSIAVDLSGATIDHHHRPPPLDPSGAIPALVVGHIYVSGEAISILGATSVFRSKLLMSNCIRRFSLKGSCCLSCIVRRTGTFDSRFLAQRLKG